MTDLITILPLSALRENPFNPRRDYPEASILELAESIASQGVLQPIVVRPLPDGQADIEHRWEIVFGHRRFRAARTAQLDGIPAIVREMPDTEAAIAQLIENRQRLDVHAVEEADALLRLQETHKLKPDDIAQRIGKSRAYVYGRLKMARMSDAVRAACNAHGLPAEIALEVARIPHALQARALETLREKVWTAGEGVPVGWVSSREAKRKLRDVFRNLDDAPWPLDDATLAPGAGACTTCPRRAGNDPDLQGEVAPATCTDPGCWDVKAGALRQRKIDGYRAAGHRVIEGDEARQLMPTPWATPPGLVPLDHKAYAETSFEQALEQLADQGQKPPTPVYLVNPHRPGSVRGYIDVQQAKSVLAKLGQQATAEDLDEYEQDDDEDDFAGDDDTDPDAPRTTAGERLADRTRDARIERTLDWSDAERLTLDRDAWHRVRIAVVRAIGRTPRTIDELRDILLREYEMGGSLGLPGEVWGLGDDAYGVAVDAAEEHGQDLDAETWYRARIAEMSADASAALLVALSIDDRLMGSVWRSGRPARENASELVALAERYGVDVVEAGREPEADPAPAPAPAEAGSTPSTAAQAQGNAAGKPGKAGKHVRYRCADTGATWSGRGLKPAWVKAALARGKTLAELEVKKVPDEARSAGNDEADNAASAGDERTSDLFTAEAAA